MIHGAALAGAAIDVSRTTAAHALSYELTARLRLAHGAAVALNLDWLMDRHAVLTDGECRHPDGAEAVRTRTAKIQQMARELSGGDRRSPDPAALASGRARNNPCVLGEPDIVRFLM